MAATAPAAQQQVALMPEQFMQTSKNKTSRIASNIPYVDGGSTTIPLPQAGLAHCLYVNISGSVTIAGTVTGGTFADVPYPAPFSAVKQVTFGSNNAFNMRQHTGWGWYKWLRNRYGFDPFSRGSTENFSPVNIAALGISSTNRIVPGALIAAGTYKFNMTLPMPLSYNEMAETGLIVLQSNNTIFNLVLNWGQISGGIAAGGGSNDFFTGLTGSNLVITPTVTVSVGLDWFEAIPADLSNLTNYFMSVNEQQFPLVAGTNTLKPPPNDYYTTLSYDVVNNGARVTNMSNLVFGHSGQIQDHVDDLLTWTARSYWRHAGNVPIDGQITYDFGIRRGFLNRRDSLDAFNNQNVTNLVITFDIPTSTTITAPSGTTLIMEALRKITQ